MALADTTDRTHDRARLDAVGDGPRLDALDGLRGLAALGVLVLHVWMFHYGDAGRPAKGFGDAVVGELRLGVQLFFVLSGFLLYRPFVGAALDGARRPSLRRYAVRRTARILPAYLAAVAGAFLLLRHLGHPLQVDLGQLPILVLFAQNQFEATRGHLDPPVWTLAVEVSFYVVLPAVALVAARLGSARGRQLALALALFGAGLACTAAAALQRWPATVSTSLLLHLGEFGAGMATATVLHRRRLGRPATVALAVAGAVLVVANSWWHAGAIGPQQTREMVGDAPGVVGLALLVAVTVAGAWRMAPLGRAPVRWLGTVSYGVYLVHFPVIVWLRRTGRWPDGLGGELAAVAAISLLLAAASWLVLERPAIRWARRATSRGGRDGRRTAGAPRPATARRGPRQPTGELGLLRPQPAER